MPVEVPVPIDPSQGFTNLVNAWNAAYKAGALADGQGFWHAGNTLDAYVTYLANAKDKTDTAGIVALSQRLFEDNWKYNDSTDPIGQPRWWRDDYGWWGMAFLNAFQNAKALGIEPITLELVVNADLCWQIMDTNWEARKHQGVLNADPAVGGTTNTITNVLFLMLSVRLYELSPKKDQQWLDAATGVFDWFYGAPPPVDGESGLYNSKNLIRYYPSNKEADRAWSGDQGWFLRACYDLRKLNPARKDQTTDVISKLQPAVFAYLFDSDRVAHELDDTNNFNFDIDFATGIGVFMRQFAYVDMNIPDYQTPWADWIRKTAQGAANYSGWNDPAIPPQKSGGWDSENSQEYAKLWYPMLLWDMTRKTSALDAFAAYLTVGAG